MNETSIWSDIYPIVLLIVCFAIASIPWCPEPYIWLWRRLRKSAEAPIDFQSIHEEQKSRRTGRRLKRREKREGRIGKRGTPIE